MAVQAANIAIVVLTGHPHLSDEGMRAVLQTYELATNNGRVSECTYLTDPHSGSRVRLGPRNDFIWRDGSDDMLHSVQQDTESPLPEIRSVMCICKRVRKVVSYTIHRDAGAAQMAQVET